jgi:hypothetical protein
VPRRRSRGAGTSLRQGAAGIGLVALMAAVTVTVGWLLAVVVSWIY